MAGVTIRAITPSVTWARWDPRSSGPGGMFHLAEWIGADALDLGNEMERGREAWLEVEKARCGGHLRRHRSHLRIANRSKDHDSFQNIGVATLGWNGLVDGYPCYHRECDTMDTMIEYMDTTIQRHQQPRALVGYCNLVGRLCLLAHGPDARP